MDLNFHKNFCLNYLRSLPNKTRRQTIRNIVTNAGKKPLEAFSQLFSDQSVVLEILPEEEVKRFIRASSIWDKSFEDSNAEENEDEKKSILIEDTKISTDLPESSIHDIDITQNEKGDGNKDTRKYAVSNKIEYSKEINNEGTTKAKSIKEYDINLEKNTVKKSQEVYERMEQRLMELFGEEYPESPISHQEDREIASNIEPWTVKNIPCSINIDGLSLSNESNMCSKNLDGFRSRKQETDRNIEKSSFPNCQKSQLNKNEERVTVNNKESIPTINGERSSSKRRELVSDAYMGDRVQNYQLKIDENKALNKETRDRGERRSNSGEKQPEINNNNSLKNKESSFENLSRPGGKREERNVTGHKLHLGEITIRNKGEKEISLHNRGSKCNDHSNSSSKNKESWSPKSSYSTLHNNKTANSNELEPSVSIDKASKNEELHIQENKLRFRSEEPKRDETVTTVIPKKRIRQAKHDKPELSSITKAKSHSKGNLFRKSIEDYAKLRCNEGCFKRRQSTGSPESENDKNPKLVCSKDTSKNNDLPCSPTRVQNPNVGESSQPSDMVKRSGPTEKLRKSSKEDYDVIREPSRLSSGERTPHHVEKPLISIRRNSSIENIDTISGRKTPNLVEKTTKSLKRSESSEKTNSARGSSNLSYHTDKTSKISSINNILVDLNDALLKFNIPRSFAEDTYSSEKNVRDSPINTRHQSSEVVERSSGQTWNITEKHSTSTKRRNLSPEYSNVTPDFSSGRKTPCNIDGSLPKRRKSVIEDRDVASRTMNSTAKPAKISAKRRSTCKELDATPTSKRASVLDDNRTEKSRVSYTPKKQIDGTQRITSRSTSSVVMREEKEKMRKISPARENISIPYGDLLEQMKTSPTTKKTIDFLEPLSDDTTAVAGFSKPNYEEEKGYESVIVIDEKEKAPNKIIIRRRSVHDIREDITAAEVRSRRNSCHFEEILVKKEPKTTTDEEVSSSRKEQAQQDKKIIKKSQTEPVEKSTPEKEVSKSSGATKKENIGVSNPKVRGENFKISVGLQNIDINKIIPSKVTKNIVTSDQNTPDKLQDRKISTDPKINKKDSSKKSEERITKTVDDTGGKILNTYEAVQSVKHNFISLLYIFIQYRKEVNQANCQKVLSLSSDIAMRKQYFNKRHNLDLNMMYKTLTTTKVSYFDVTKFFYRLIELLNEEFKYYLEITNPVITFYLRRVILMLVENFTSPSDEHSLFNRITSCASVEFLMATDLVASDMDNQMNRIFNGFSYKIGAQLADEIINIPIVEPPIINPSDIRTSSSVCKLSLPVITTKENSPVKPNPPQRNQERLVEKSRDNRSQNVATADSRCSSPLINSILKNLNQNESYLHDNIQLLQAYFDSIAPNSPKIGPKSNQGNIKETANKRIEPSNSDCPKKYLKLVDQDSLKEYKNTKIQPNSTREKDLIEPALTKLVGPATKIIPNLSQMKIEPEEPSSIEDINELSQSGFPTDQTSRSVPQTDRINTNIEKIAPVDATDKCPSFESTAVCSVGSNIPVICSRGAQNEAISVIKYGTMNANAQNGDLAQNVAQVLDQNQPICQSYPQIRMPEMLSNNQMSISQSMAQNRPENVAQIWSNQTQPIYQSYHQLGTPQDSNNEMYIPQSMDQNRPEYMVNDSNITAQNESQTSSRYYIPANFEQNPQQGAQAPYVPNATQNPENLSQFGAQMQYGWPHNNAQQFLGSSPYIPYQQTYSNVAQYNFVTNSLYHGLNGANYSFYNNTHYYYNPNLIQSQIPQNFNQNVQNPSSRMIPQGHLVQNGEQYVPQNTEQFATGQPFPVITEQDETMIRTYEQGMLEAQRLLHEVEMSKQYVRPTAQNQKSTGDQPSKSKGTRGQRRSPKVHNTSIVGGPHQANGGARTSSGFLENCGTGLQDGIQRQVTRERIHGIQF